MKKETLTKRPYVKPCFNIIQMKFVTPFAGSPDTKTNGNLQPTIVPPKDDGEEEIFG